MKAIDRDGFVEIALTKDEISTLRKASSLLRRIGLIRTGSKNIIDARCGVAIYEAGNLASSVANGTELAIARMCARHGWK